MKKAPLSSGAFREETLKLNLGASVRLSSDDLKRLLVDNPAATGADV
jgi:hypothetical protein